jgi:UDP-N-acetylglucosamine 4,6-dehydratase/5-epimerase
LNWNNEVVLVTGGTGSFGRRFTKIMLEEFKPKKLIIFSRDELKQMEMRASHTDRGDSPMRYFIGDVRDRDRLMRAMKDVTLVIHAAALKQVPACEYNPFEAVQTNILGSKNVIDAALDAGVRRALIVCTDKAVSPTNLYGATKLCAEKLFVHGNAYSGKDGCWFAAARYGNVVGSRGSVIPLFLKQREFGEVSITDKRMTRFWITLDQGVRLVIRSIEIMQGGEIFVPKIPSMRLAELAEAIAPDCSQRITGIRRGEKLHEVLVSTDEARHTLEYDDMYIIQPEDPWWTRGRHSDGKPLPDEFSYRSDTNPLWLTHDDLRRILEQEMNINLTSAAVAR